MNPLHDINYHAFVGALAKPGQDIIDSLTPEKAHLWHMSGELRGELLELQIALENNDAENVLEEAGDMLFYIQGCFQFPGCSFFMPSHNFEAQVIERLDHDEGYLDIVERYPHSTLLREVEAATTMAKRIVLYEKPSDDKTDFSPALWRAVAHLGNTLRQHGHTLADAFAHNREKLGERLPDGVYSNKAMQDRADKKEGE